MRVAHLSFESMHNVCGGLGVMVTDLIKAQSRIPGVRPVLVVPSSGSIDQTNIGITPETNLALEGRDYEADIYVLPDHDLVVLKGGWLSEASGVYPQPSDLCEAVKATEFGSLAGILLRHLDIQMIHIHDFHGYGVIPFAKRLGIPTLYTAHLLHKITPMLNHLEHLAVSSADATSIVSQGYYDENQDFFDLSSEPFVQHNGYDASFWRADASQRTNAKACLLKKLELEDQVTLCFVGRIDSYQKGVDILLSALKKLHEHQQSCFNFVFAGKGWADVETEIRVFANQNMQSVRFLNHFLTREEVRELLTGADFTVVPSRFEPFGLIQIEAAAVGCVPIVSRSGGLLEINRELVSFSPFPTSFEANNCKALASCLLTIIAKTGRDPSLMGQLRASIQENVRAFTMEAVATSYVSRYREKIEGTNTNKELMQGLEYGIKERS